MNKIDSAGLKFKILREFGEDVDISFVKFNNGLPTKLFVRGHEYSDGLGFFADLFERHYEKSVGVLPIAKSDNKPGFFKRFFYFIKHIIRQRPRNYQWLADKNQVIEASLGFCHYTLDKSLTKSLYKYCKDNNISINSLMIKLFDEVVTNNLLTSNSNNLKRVWMIPVSLRSEEERNLRYGNFVTTLSVYTDNSSTSKSIYEQMKKMLKSGLPWGGLWVANISKILGEEKMRKMSAKDVKAPYVGLITNLGKWSFDFNKCREDRWTLVAPVSRFAPVSVSLFDWNSELSISMQLHPLLKKNPAESEILFKKVLDSVFEVLEKDIQTHGDVFVRWEDLECHKSII